MESFKVKVATLVGLIFAYGVGFYLPTPQWKMSFFEKSDIDKMDIYKSSDKKRIAVVSNCLLGHYELYNDPESQNKIINSSTGLFSEIINAYNIKNNHDIAFYNLSRTQTGVRDFTFYFYKLLEESQVSDIIFSHEYGSMGPEQTTDLASSLEFLHILKLLQTKYPDLSDAIQKLRNPVLASQDTKDALSVYGENFEAYLDSSSLTLPRYDIEGANSQWFMSDGSANNEIRFKMGLFESVYLGDLAKPLRQYSSWIEYISYKLAGGEGLYLKRMQGAISRDLSTAHENYQNPSLYAPIVRPFEGTYLEGITKDFYLSWLELIFEVAKRNNKKIIYYLPPYIGMTDKIYSEFFKPSYVDYVEKVANKFNFPVIDSTMKNILAPTDLIYRSGLVYQSYRGSSGVFFKLRRQPNIVGKVKIASDLMHNLATLGFDIDTSRVSTDAENFKYSNEPITGVVAEDLVLSELPVLYRLWANSLKIENKDFFIQNNQNPYDYFRESFFQNMMKKEVDLLYGFGYFTYICEAIKGTGQMGCGPKNNNLIDAFQRVDSL